jgi:hypothetical protein
MANSTGLALGWLKSDDGGMGLSLSHFVFLSIRFTRKGAKLAKSGFQTSWKPRRDALHSIPPWFPGSASRIEFGELCAFAGKQV